MEAAHSVGKIVQMSPHHTSLEGKLREADAKPMQTKGQRAKTRRVIRKRHALTGFWWIRPEERSGQEKALTFRPMSFSKL